MKKNKNKIFVLSQNQFTDNDVYGSCVVSAKNEKEAMNIRPDGVSWSDIDSVEKPKWATNKIHITCVEIGRGKPSLDSGVILGGYVNGIVRPYRPKYRIIVGGGIFYINSERYVPPLETIHKKLLERGYYETEFKFCELDKKGCVRETYDGFMKGDSVFLTNDGIDCMGYL